MTKNDSHKLDTKLVHTGRKPEDYHGIVNPPLVRASTIIAPSLEVYQDTSRKYRYGRMGTPLSHAFEESMAELEGGFKAIATCSGLSAITPAILSFLKTGDHLLMVDNVYGPVRDFCNHLLTRMGVEVEFYDPLIGAGIEKLCKANTAVIYMESPGSGTFEVQDVPSICKVAKGKGIVTIVDNTWSAGLLFRPLEHGADVVIQSATKYVGGHADVNLGVIVVGKEEHFHAVRQTTWDMGITASGDDLYGGLRGLRTMSLRMKHAGEQGMDMALWLQKRPEVEKVFYPALPGHPGHEVWKRDFSGANGLLSFALKDGYDKGAVSRFVNGLKLFPLGASWGGYESLLQPQSPQNFRKHPEWSHQGQVLRLQIGLEDMADLKADLEQAFKELKA
ncbi:MAG TPA: cystathionine beta-lyase [Alphaproteobacteria bacterium]|nr:cystathionine beta-lyase [Alphaproteobacteria bacterium]